MAKVRHQVGIDGTIEKVFSTLTTSQGFVGWWASSAKIVPEIGGKIALTFDNLTTLYFVYQDIIENGKVAILCTEGPGAWQGSELLFELIQASNQVYLTLTHTNETSSEDDFLYFNTKWPCYLLSLKSLVETAKGRPYPNDIKIHIGD